MLSEDVLDQVGQAIRAGHGFFLYGESGNGKTSVAERVSRAFGQHDLDSAQPDDRRHDHPPVRSLQPRGSAAGKQGRTVRSTEDRPPLGADSPAHDPGRRRIDDGPPGDSASTRAPGVSEAPLQLKSNCGTLVIDDFGRQRMEPAELLNRWIVPLDRRYDFLNLPNGKKIQVPFDQLLIFSTNLEPHDLVDEAFLRRIPYKIRALDPTEARVPRAVSSRSCRWNLDYDETAMDDLIQTHYRQAGRPFRCCHARDLLRQIKHYCEFKRLPLEMTAERFATAVRNYFALVKTGK